MYEPEDNQPDSTTYADLAGEKSARERKAAHERAICERLGIDPAETRSVRVEIEPLRGAVVTWEGVRRVSLTDLPDLLAP